MISFLLILIFVSKVSASFLGFFPKEISPIIYQYGMHPYVNMFFNFVVGGFLFLKWFWKPSPLFQQSRFYRLLLVLTCSYLIFVTLLQCYFVNPQESALLQMASVMMAVFTIFLYGRIIPTLLRPEKFFSVLRLVTVSLCLISFVLLFVSAGTSFKGSRFIGVFKHIPHMVSCATLACFALYDAIFNYSSTRAKLGLYYFCLLICFIVLLLTGTRSALAAVLLGYCLCLFVLRASSWANRFLKVSFALTGLLIVLFFGHDIADYSVGLARGQQAIGNRAAQDGLKSRLEEIERGYLLFEKNEWLGSGLLMKFSNGQDADVAGYDANKDPHNIFVSAGVLGGWGFVGLTLVAILALSIATIKSLFSNNRAMQLLAIYMIVNIPILLIYHIHLSLGGIADRIYWIAIGYMAITEAKRTSQDKAAPETDKF